MNKIIRLENGIRVSYEQLSHIRSTTVGCYFGAGSRYENDTNNGISHFIEHMCFKGTTKRTAFDLVCDADRIGAMFNAFTSKEMTCYYIQGLSETAEECIEILSDLVCNHTYPADELEKEKEVVIEEIKMCEDTPDDFCSELAFDSFWGEHTALGRQILGTEQTVRSFTREDLLAYEQERYVASNMVISIVTNLPEQQILDLVCKYFGEYRKGTALSYQPTKPLQTKGVKTSFKENKQANITLTFEGLSSDHQDSDALNLASVCFGGNMSSVLFQRLREELGLAYSVYVYRSSYQDAGCISIYLGTSPEKVNTALSEIKKIIDEYIEHGFSNEEFERGVNQIKSTYLMGLESSKAIMRVCAREALFNDEVFDLDEKVQKISAVTLDDTNRVFRDAFSTVPAIGYVGTQVDFDLQEFFK